MEWKLYALKKLIEWLVGGDLFLFIENAVKQINNENFSGEEKRKAVQKEAKAFFSGAMTLFINIAIEVAVLLLKSKENSLNGK